jgi:hypothetical protein
MTCFFFCVIKKKEYRLVSEGATLVPSQLDKKEGSRSRELARFTCTVGVRTYVHTCTACWLT